MEQSRRDLSDSTNNLYCSEIRTMDKRHWDGKTQGLKQRKAERRRTWRRERCTGNKARYSQFETQRP
jgi:hypothetical protein